MERHKTSNIVSELPNFKVFFDAIISLANNGQALVALLALRTTLPAEQASAGRMISARPFRRLTLRSATGFSQRENRHHQTPSSPLFANDFPFFDFSIVAAADSV